MGNTYVVSADDGVNPAVQPRAGDGRALVLDGTTTRLELTLPSAAVLSGRVVDAAGAPAANVWVSAARAWGDPGAVPFAAFDTAFIQRVLTDEEVRSRSSSSRPRRG